MNKRIYKKQQRRLIDRALSLIYGQTRHKDLAFVYRVRLHILDILINSVYDEFGNKFKKTLLMKNIDQMFKHLFGINTSRQIMNILCMAMILLRKRKRIEPVSLKDFQLLLG